MRTTLDIDRDLLEEAQRACGAGTLTATIELGLRALIAADKRRRLAALAGQRPELAAPPRRRPDESP